MITVKFFEDVIFYGFINCEAGTTSDVMYTHVMINDVVYNYYQFKEAIILNINQLGTLHNIRSVIPLRNHLKLIDLSQQNGGYNCVRIWNRNLEKDEYEFVDITRSLKLNKLSNKLKLNT